MRITIALKISRHNAAEVPLDALIYYNWTLYESCMVLLLTCVNICTAALLIRVMLPGPLSDAFTWHDSCHVSWFVAILGWRFGCRLWWLSSLRWLSRWLSPVRWLSSWDISWGCIFPSHFKCVGHFLVRNAVISQSAREIQWKLELKWSTWRNACPVVSCAVYRKGWRCYTTLITQKKWMSARSGATIDKLVVISTNELVAWDIHGVALKLKAVVGEF